MRKGKKFIDNYLDYEKVADQGGFSGQNTGYEEQGQNWRTQTGPSGWPTVCGVAGAIVLIIAFAMPKSDSHWIVATIVGVLLMLAAGFFALLNNAMRDDTPAYSSADTETDTNSDTDFDQRV